MRRPNMFLLDAMRKLRDAPGFEDARAEFTVNDSPEARILGLVPYTPRVAGKTAPAQVPAQVPALMPANPSSDQQLARCDECHDEVPWQQATFRSFATLCDNPQCEVNAQRKFDGLPVES